MPLWFSDSELTISISTCALVDTRFDEANVSQIASKIC